MEDVYVLIAIILIVVGILQIILFFKLWGMTNDIREIKTAYISSINDTHKSEPKIEVEARTYSDFQKGDKIVIIRTKGSDIVESSEVENGILKILCSSGKTYKGNEVEHYNKYWSNYVDK